MEEFSALKSSGTKKLQAKKYVDAIQDFSTVIDRLPEPSNEGEINIKCACLINRSACQLVQGKFEEATTDAKSAIEICTGLHKDEKDYFKKNAFTPLSQLYTLANIRLGEIEEAQNHWSAAFTFYQKAREIEPDGPAKKAYRELLKRFDIPDIRKGGDPSLEIFYKIREDLSNESKTKENLVSVISLLSSQKKEGDPFIRKFDTLKYANIFYALLQIYIDKEMIAYQTLIILRLFSQRQVKSIWSDFLCIKAVMLHYKENSNIMCECIRFLNGVPHDRHIDLIKNDFLPLIIDTFKFPKLSENEIESIFYLLFYIAQSPSNLTHLVENAEVLNQIYEKKSIGSLMLLSKLSQIPEVVIVATGHGCIEWILEMVRSKPEKIEVTIAASVFLSRVLIGRIDEENIKNKQQIEEIFDSFSPILMKNSKRHDLVSSIFACFDLALKFCPEKAKQHKLVRLASLLLSLYIRNHQITQNIVTFFYECSENGLLDEIKECQAALPTVIKALQTHPDVQTIVERACAFAFLCDYENKNNLVKAAIQQYSNSEFLAKFIKDHPIA